MKNLKNQVLYLITILMTVSFLFRCQDNDNNTNQVADDKLSSSLSDTVPADLAVTSPTGTLSGEAIADAVLSGSLTPKEEPPPPENNANDYKTKVSMMKKVLTTTDKNDCMEVIPHEFNLSQGIFGHSRCSSAAMVSVSNHPDTGGTWSSGAGDLGLWEDYSEPGETSGLACSASVINNAMTSVAAYSDSALGMHAMLACAGRIDKVQAPEKVGSSVNLLSNLSGIDTSIKAFSVSAASISREENTKAGQAVFLTSMEGVLTDVPRNITSPYRLRVRHVPAANEKESYFGVIQFEIDKLEDGNPGIISISYAFDGSTISYRYRQSKAPANPTDGFDTTSYEIKNDIEFSMTEVIVNNDTNGFGKLILAWTAGGSMVFNAETKNNGSGVAYFGNTETSTAGTDDYYKIFGFKCNNSIVDSYVQMQTLLLNTDSGIWELDSSKIKYAPTNSCSWNSVNDTEQNAVFTVTNQDVSSINYDLGYPYEQNLEQLSTYKSDWTAPNIPANHF